MELISVIIPIYNTFNYLERCVESVRKQIRVNIEIILVDDGSTDGCSDLCDEFQKKDARIKVIHKKNEGQGIARNEGLKLAKGKYVTFVDSDDWIGENHIYNLYKEISLSDADAVLGNHVRVDIKGEQSIKMLSLEEKIYEGEELLNKIILPLVGANQKDSTDMVINSSVSMNLYNMSLIKKQKIEFISERAAIAEDFFFNLDFLCNASSVAFCNENGYFYCQNTESTCEKYNAKRFARTLNYYDLLSERIKKYELHDCVDYRADRSFLMKLRVAIRHIVMSELSRKEKLRQIKEILSNDKVQKVLNEYPIESYFFSMRLLMKQMRRRNSFGVYYLMLWREKGRNKKGAKAFLKWIGIGR